MGIDAGQQRDQVDKLWDSVELLKKTQERHYTEFRELRVTVLGVDGKNGIRGKLDVLQDSVGQILEKTSKGHLTCPIAQKLEEHLKGHEKKETELLTSRRFFIGQLITIIIFIVGFVLRR